MSKKNLGIMNPENTFVVIRLAGKFLPPNPILTPQ